MKHDSIKRCAAIQLSAFDLCSEACCVFFFFSFSAFLFFFYNKCIMLSDCPKTFFWHAGKKQKNAAEKDSRLMTGYFGDV